MTGRADEASWWPAIGLALGGILLGLLGRALRVVDDNLEHLGGDD
ncbi:MAG TPA: hypothetical protein VIR33_11690 [Thermopolyspora sp.]